MCANENVSFSIPRFGHNVSAISSELLQLDIKADFFEFTGEVFGSSGRAGTPRMPALTRGIGQPGDVAFEAVDGNSGKRQQRDKQGYEENRDFFSLHL